MAPDANPLAYLLQVNHMGGGSSKTPKMSAAPVVQAEAPKVYQQEQSMSDAAQAARDNQKQKALAALGQQGTVLTSPFGSQESMQKQQGKTLLGG